MLEINKIHNMDCLEAMKEIDENSIDCIIADPPYNVGIDEWDKIEDYEHFCIEWIEQSIRILKPNKAFWIFSNQHNVTTINFILNKISSAKFRNWIVWNKGTGIPTANSFTNNHEQILYYIKQPDNIILKEFGNYLKSKREKLNLSLKEVGNLCDEKWYHRGGHLYFETGLSKPNPSQYGKLKEVLNLDNRFDKWFNNGFVFNLEKVGIKWKYEKDKRNKRGWKNCGDVWNIPQLSGTFKERINHPCQKPIKLIERMIKVSTNNNDVVLDLFSGTGTTSLVCKKLGRNFIGFENDEEWYNVSLNRLLSQPERLENWVEISC